MTSDLKVEIRFQDTFIHKPWFAGILYFADWAALEES